MKIKIYPIFLIFIFLVIFFVFYKGLKNSNIYIPNVEIQIEIPEFQAKNFENNKDINSKDIFLDDKFYLLNIWASWCVPCRKEHKYLMNLNKEKKKSKLHNLETLVGFLDLHDEIYIKKTNKKNHIIKFTGNFSNKIPKKNTISNLLKILDEAKKLKNQKYLISIKKNIGYGKAAE